MKVLSLICRILVGVLFIISGLIKANDPLGFSYKLDEYFVVFGMEWMSPLALVLSMLICIVEMICGVACLTGSYMRFFSALLLLMIIFFTFLTFYSAYFNKVTDCGCFGDALKGAFGRSLTPWESFTKDIVLFVLIIPIFLTRKSIRPVFTPMADNIVLFASGLLVTWFTIYCYSHLPVKDFRPYAIGKNIPEQMKIPEGAPVDVYQTLLYYEKNGVVKEFTDKNYPWDDSTWVWKETKSVLISKGFEPPIHDFSIKTFDDYDYTQDILNNPEYNFMLIAYDISKTDRKVQPAINEFVKKCTAANISFIGVTASSYEATDTFRHEVQAMYDYYSADATTLKTIIRSNPGLVLLKGGTVIDMWHYNDFPTFEEVKNKHFKN